MNLKCTILYLLILPCLIYAQPLDGLKLVAHYPLTSDANDALGQNDPADLVNVPFQDGGVYLSGISASMDPENGSELVIPPISGLEFKKFAVSFKFKVTENYAESKPVFVFGYSWRYLTVRLSEEMKIGFTANSSYWTGDVSNTVVEPGKWHEVVVTHDSLQSLSELYYNGTKIMSINEALNFNGDRTFSTTSGETSESFKGYISDIKIYSLDETAAVELQNKTMDTFKLLQNYPNPFNPTTTIIFDIQKPGDYELALYDIQGRKVRTLANGYMHRDHYTISFTASNLPSGVYVTRLSGNGASQAKRLVLLK